MSNFKSAREQVSALERELNPAKESFYRFLQENDPAGRVKYTIFGWGDTVKPIADRYTYLTEEYRLNLNLSTDTEIAFSFIDYAEEEERFFMIPATYLEDPQWEQKILADMKTDADLVRNELIELVGAAEINKVDIFTELYVVDGDPNPAFGNIFHVYYHRKTRITNSWLSDLVMDFRSSKSSGHYYSRVTNGLYSYLPFHLIEHGYHNEWEKYRVQSDKDYNAKINRVLSGS